MRAGTNVLVKSTSMEKQTRTGNSDSLAYEKASRVPSCHGNRQHQRRGAAASLGHLKYYHHVSPFPA